MSNNNSINNIIYGVTTNSNAAAGQVGEYISSSILFGSSISLTSTFSSNVTSISLTAGDWDVRGVVSFTPAGTTTSSDFRVAINTVSASLPTIGAENNISASSTAYAAAGYAILPVGTMRISLSATTTVYLVARAIFAVSTMTAYGFIGARRVR